MEEVLVRKQYFFSSLAAPKNYYIFSPALFEKSGLQLYVEFVSHLLLLPKLEAVGKETFSAWARKDNDQAFNLVL